MLRSSCGLRTYMNLLQRVPAGFNRQAFNQYQLLCALREGPFGVAGLNERMSIYATEAQNSSSSALSFVRRSTGDDCP
ncbi:hypothetical protein ACNKHV_17615 [Shigella flexneri]